MKADEALALISLRARFDIGALYDVDGKLLPIAQWPETARLCVKGIKPGPFGDTIVLYDGLRAAELMAVEAGHLKGKVELEHTFPHRALLGDAPPAGTE